jgi:uncharacterized protein YkwD
LTLGCGQGISAGGIASGTSYTSGSNSSAGASLDFDCHEMDAQSCEAFKATNEARVQNAVAPLKFCEVCFQMAQEQSEDMYARNYFSHDRPAFPDRPAESFSERVARFGLSSGVGENIAGGATGRAAVDMWMNSPGHRANILNPNFTSFAVGTKGSLTTQVFSM